MENSPKTINNLPKNLPEVHHRARDIIFSDKTEHSVTMAKVITRYLDYIEELYKIIENNIDHVQISQKQLTRIRRKYKKYKQEHGSQIKEIYHIRERSHFLTCMKMPIFHLKQSRNQLEKEKTKQIKH